MRPERDVTDTALTLDQHLLHAARETGLDTDLVILLNSIATACKAISASLRDGALAGVLGSHGSQNVQGETQKKLDVIANDIFLEHCAHSGVLACMVSEELDEVQEIPARFARGRYVLFFDPLDGSSNIDVNVSVGSIFSILRLEDVPETTDYATVLRAGVEQVAAGYALYGPSTMLMLSTGDGVRGFTLDTGLGEFRLTHDDIAIPAAAGEFAINASRAQWWEPPVRRYVEECVQGESGPRGKTFNMRWVASMVAEVHRILIRGGVFLYPMDEKNRTQGGKLRLFYEANPMAFLVEQAGGAASTGRTRIMEVEPDQPHQRVPVILGARDEVALIDGYHAEFDAS
ncbi:class 1 fructose-bisphosphatase [Arenibacterium halophilum]|uniref:Fructose-1,6-bisphosphatase class 1 n=1 Tax=Arenibacterium halophilum TaxID=2583821 RepID=A0ABY2X9F9_9RHOB|nr:class 1 fructose-bisphosphatase [Arenibacterium halophilum]